jgi:hypothetical protein
VQNFLESLFHQGFAIVSDVMPTPEMDRLATDLETSTVSRSRAGIRHAMKVPAVAAVARDPRLHKLARQQFRTGRLSSPSPRTPTGW